MKKINFKKTGTKKKIVVSLSFLAALFLFVSPVSAGIESAVANVVGNIMDLLVRGVANILILVVNLLMDVASYSDFINAAAVSRGWVVVRDLCNMFFVIILLIIAFATILGQEEYGAQKMLPKLIMAAVLINFSKLICGLMIDVANVVMLTFVKAFSAIGAGNMLDMLGISSVVKLNTTGGDISLSSVVGAYIFGLIYVLIATVVVAAMLGMLVMRVVMIWILVVLSPLAFFLQAVPGKGGSYAAQWWTKWSSNLIVGPVIAFFLWLSFAALQTDNGNPIKGSSSGDDELTASNGVSVGSEAGTVTGMARFVIAIGMLLGGMKIAQGVGGEAASALGKGFSKGKGMLLGAGAAAGGFALARGKALANATGRGARNLALGGVAGVASIGKKDPITGKSTSKTAQFALNWRDNLQNERKKKKATQREAFLKKMGVGGESAKNLKDVVDNFNSKMPKSRKYKEAKDFNENYKNSGIKDTDKTIVDGLRTKMQNNPNYTENMWTDDEKDAVARSKQYASNEKTVNREKNKPLDITARALKNMTEKYDRAEKKMGVIAKDQDYFSGLGKGGIYNKKGIDEKQKLELDMMNTSDVASDGYKARQVLINQINGTNGAKRLIDDETEEVAKLISAYEKGGNDSLNLSDVKAALNGRGYDPSSYTDKVLVNYRDFDKNKMIVNKGKGELKYDAFAKNSLKSAGERLDKKDVLGASFEQINNKAREMGVNMTPLEMAPAATIDNKEQLSKISTVMASLIDDEISKLQKSVDEASANNPVIAASQQKIKDLQAGLSDLDSMPQGTIAEKVAYNKKKTEIDNQIKQEQGVINKELSSNPNANKISQLQAAKGRLEKQDLSKIKLQNTDISYKGETDTEKRQNSYNSIQHENMHGAGAKNEELVHDASDALQEARLIGAIPGTGGKQSYDTEIGKMIAGMESLKFDPKKIEEAVVKKISQWSVPNAQRVIETEKGVRDSQSGVIENKAVKSSDSSKEAVGEEIANDWGGENKEVGEEIANDWGKTSSIAEDKLDAINESLAKLTKVLETDAPKGKGVQSQIKNIQTKMSVEDVNFFRRMFTNLDKKVTKAIGKNPKPLSVMAASEEAQD